MTLAGFVAKNAVRNKRRAVPTILSIGFSIQLLTIMMSLWRSFYMDQLSPSSTIRVFTRSPHVPARGIWFNWKYVEEAVPYAKDDMYILLADSPQEVTPIESAVDDMFGNSPSPTRTETEKQFELDFIAMLGNVKAFILSICMAVVFAVLLVSANTMAMTIRKRAREVALLKTLGFTRRTVLTLLVAESVTLSLAGGLLGLLAAYGLSYKLVHSARSGSFALAFKITPGTLSWWCWLWQPWLGFSAP
jgi:FtsX-like permease family